MWPDLKEQLAVESAQLERLIEIHRPLLLKCRTEEPNAIELSALAAMLHSFYTGIENLFRRVALEVDGALLRGDAWHRRLLQQMTEAGEKRPSLISAGLYERLHPYLQFRHVFRNSYSFQLRWDKMRPLVLGCEETFTTLRIEMASFVDRMDEIGGRTG
ncbi:MAG TPA: hypothetical protein VIW92_06120 [Thermoanaerobaculia bacterium]